MKRSGRELNLRPIGCKCDALTATPHANPYSPTLVNEKVPGNVTGDHKVQENPIATGTLLAS